jgi:hypothetical protein
MAYVLTSYGEIIDKYTILQIKLEHITDLNKQMHILEDIDALVLTVNTLQSSDQGIVDLTKSLKTVNEALWLIEDNIRIKERLSQFDDEFIALARSVYLKNDERAQLKYKINLLTNSPLIEEKSYPEK